MYNKTEADQIAIQARYEYDAGLKFRHDREASWSTIEDFYFNRVKKSLKSKFNAPVPIVPGFIDTWQAKISRHNNLDFEQTEDADYRSAKKAGALYKSISTHDDYDWEMLETDGDKMAGLYGRAVYEYQARSEPKYESELNLIDVYDFITDPLGGGADEKAQYRGVDNVLRSKEELKDGVDQGIYDAGQVSKLINATKKDTLRSNDTVYQSKQNRLLALNLNGISYNYVGQDVYKLIKFGTTYKGKRVYIVFDYNTGIWIRCQPLVEVFKSNLWPWMSWAPNRDSFNYWSKAPAEDIVPLAEIIRVLVMQDVDNRNKKNYKQRAYDPDMFPNPAELEWRQDGLVAVKSGTSKLMPIANGVYNFETEQLSGTLNLVNYLDNLLKEKTGVNSESQGQADTSKVGIAYLNVQQSAERSRSIYESRTKCKQAIGRRFLWGLWEHMRKPMAVKIIGEKGEEWDEIARNEINTDWNISVSGGLEETNRDEIRKKATRESLLTLTPDELAVTNPKWRAKVKLQAADISDDEIILAFDLTDETNREVLSRASQMIQDVLAGKETKPFRGATTTFVQKIVDYATNNDLSLDEYNSLMKLAQVHMPIAQENAVRKAMTTRGQKGLPSGLGQPDTGSMISGIPPTGTMPGTQSQSQQMTAMAPQANNMQ